MGAATEEDRHATADHHHPRRAELAGMNEEYLQWFPVDPPARYAAKLGAEIPGILISIRMTAVVS